VDTPPDNEHILQPLRNQRARFSKTSIVTMLALICLLLFLFSGLLLFSLPQLSSKSANSVAAPQTQQPAQSQTLAPTATDDQGTTATPTPPLVMPKNMTIAPLQLPANRYVIYEQQSNLYVVSTNDGQSQIMPTQDYVYSQAVRPILTPSGKILYAGDGLWLTDISSDSPTQIATLAPGEVITSMALSNDGKMIAWSTEPKGGKGMIDIHAGPITSPTIVYEQSALVCPCFRIFSFMNGSGSKADNTLLLTDDQGSHEAVQFGLWSLDLSALPATPQPTPVLTPSSSPAQSTPSPVAYPSPTPVLDENPQQGPLALAPSGNILLYSSNEGWVPIPTDYSVPQDIGSLTYPNGLDFTTLSGTPLRTNTPQVVLPEQHNLNNNADYYWVTTPVFSPDGHTLVFVEFTSDVQEPFDRHSAIFTVQITGSGTHLHANAPQLLATSPAKLLELGPWISSNILTFYSDGSLYALDIKSGAVTTLVQTGVYARIIAIVGG
jgi:WD40-like Beta Propeller Repeat